MKHQYVGDINDFYKYQLLRVSQRFFRPLIVAWMLTPADRRGDGARIQYLSRSEVRAQDPELFEAMSSLISQEERHLAAVERSGVLRHCEFIPQPLPATQAGRAAYFQEVAQLAAGEEALVFFDPDNGIEVPSVPKHRRGAERYLYWDELGLIRDDGSSAIIYQHFPRVHRRQYLAALMERLEAEMGPAYETFAWHSTLVAFLFVIRKERAGELQRALLEHCATSNGLALFQPAKPKGAVASQLHPE